MKTLIKNLLTICSIFLLSQGKLYSQVYDVVSIGAGYPNQSFYSLANGEISNISNTDWDLGFQISGFQATILINGKDNVRLFKSDLDINSWSSITANDTIGKLDPAHELFNQDTSWWAGAFNITNDPANMFDLGWGVYDFATHVVAGDSLFFIKLGNGDVKKLWIQSLANNIYNFAYADVDGSNEVNASLNKQDFAGKNFGYYSIQNGTQADREPNKYLWDLTFMQYMATTPFIYKVTGVLSNDSVSAVKAYPVDESTVTPWGYTFSNYINTIGYDWKAFDFNNNIWTIADSTVYFVYDRNGGLWKLVFTGFGGAVDGNFEFNKQQVSATGVNETLPAILGVYPNPATSGSTMTLLIPEADPSNHAVLYDSQGRKVSDINIADGSGLFNVNIPIEHVTPGIYYIHATIGGRVNSHKLLVGR